MKRKLQYLMSAAAASVLAFSALAQDTPIPKSNGPEYTRDRSPHPRHMDKLNGAVRACDLIGMAVNDDHNEKLGKVQDVAVDVESGRIVQVILATSGVIGASDTPTTVPPGALHHDAAHKVLHLSADKDRLANDRQSMIPALRLAPVQKASKLIGTPVKNRQDQTLGKVEDLLLDLPAGRVVAIILSSGGFLGLGDELSAIPPTVLRFTAERDVLQLDTSKEALSSAPHFKANQWPDFTQTSYTGEIYRAYRVEPYFTSNETTQPDNTVRNVREREDLSLTPPEQVNHQADAGTTAQIRKEISAEKNMSVNARNVRIITIDGRVTLRGPVDTDEEKRVIGEIADRNMRSGKADNQLEVKLLAGQLIQSTP